MTTTHVRNNKVTPCLLAFGPLLGNSATKEVAKTCVEMIRNHSVINDRKDLLAIAGVMAGLNPKPEVWREVFKEFDMDRNISPFLLEVHNKGRSEASTETRLVMVEELEENFKSKMPADIRKAIEDQTDHRTLVRWHGRLTHCTTWNAVRQHLGLPIGG